jgi:mycofactocin system creatininase family protein
MSALLADRTWPDVDARAILAVPVGSTEQHGPHLPLSTDTDVAVALSNRLAAARDDVLIAPPIAYGSSGEHAGFAGTLSIGREALELLLVELGRSACETFARVLLVSAHGGNHGPVTRAVTRLRAESRDVRAHMPRWEGEPHAGRTETAMILALTPDRVWMDRAEPGDTRPLTEVMPALRAGGVRAVAPNGVLGDPTGATAIEGAALLDELAAVLRKDVEGWWPR